MDKWDLWVETIVLEFALCNGITNNEARTRLIKKLKKMPITFKRASAPIMKSATEEE